MYHYCLLLLVLQVSGLSEAMVYTGLVYYEENSVENVMTFTVARRFNKLLEVYNRV